MKRTILLNFFVLLLYLYEVSATQGIFNVKGPYICVDCDNMPHSMIENCVNITKPAKPCAPYYLVRDRLCQRMCRAIYQKACRQVVSVCNENPDCPELCRSMFSVLCPTTITEDQAVIPKGDPCDQMYREVIFPEEVEKKAQLAQAHDLVLEPTGS